MLGQNEERKLSVTDNQWSRDGLYPKKKLKTLFICMSVVRLTDMARTFKETFFYFLLVMTVDFSYFFTFRQS